jgi:peptide/nickel transport system ATP-binding protein
MTLTTPFPFSAMPVLSVQNLSLATQNKILLENVSFDVMAGQCLALVGESGSGKSLTALACCRLLPDAVRIVGGEVLLGNQEGSTAIFTLPNHAMCSIRGKRIGLVFQEPNLALNPVMTVGQQLIEAIVLHLPAQAVRDKRTLQSLAVAALLEVGIVDGDKRLNDYPMQFSGGQKQRIMIAMALAGSPELLIADEPTTALDVLVQAHILQLLKTLQTKRSMAVLLITHDLNCVRHMADTVVVLQAGRVVESRSAQAFFSAPDHLHSQDLLASNTQVVLCDEPKSAKSDLLTAQGISARYPLRFSWVKSLSSRQSPPKSIPLLNQLSLSVPQGETLALLGVSGSGKTTLAKVLLGLHDVALQVDGHVVLNRFNKLASSRPSRTWQQQMSVVFQDPYASFNPRMRMYDSLMEGIKHLRSDWSSQQADRMLARLMHAVDLPLDSLNRWPHEFSGGQRQRLAIVRALAVAPSLLILDEPSSALDSTVQVKLLQLLVDLQREFGYSYLVITHDFYVVKAMAQHVAVLHQGSIIEQGLTAQVFSRPQHAHTQALLAAGYLKDPFAVLP